MYIKRRQFLFSVEGFRTIEKHKFWIMPTQSVWVLSNFDEELASNKKIGSNIIIDKRGPIKNIWKKIVDSGNNVLEINLESETKATHGLLIIPLTFFVILTTLGITLIPRYNVVTIFYRSYGLMDGILDFFEFVLYSSVIFFDQLFNFRLVMGRTAACGGRAAFIYYLSILFALLFSRWTIRIVNYYYRLHSNINQIFAITVSMTSRLLTLWYQHPKFQRSDPHFRTRYKWYVLIKIVAFFLIQAYNQTAILFNRINDLYQILLAFWLLLLRYLAMKIFNKMVTKARGDDELSARFTVGCGVACNHAFYLMIIVGSKAIWQTTLVYLIVDTLLIFRLYNRIFSAVKDNADKDDINFRLSIQALTSKDAMEIIVPFCFYPIYLIAFLGPNKETLCPVKGRSVDDLLSTLMNIGGFMIYDGIRIGSFALFLNYRYKISLFKSYCKMMNNYWKLITATIAAFVYLVSFHDFR